MMNKIEKKIENKKIYIYKKIKKTESVKLKMSSAGSVFFFNKKKFLHVHFPAKHNKQDCT